MVEEKVEEIFPSQIKSLNEEGWSVIQVIAFNYEKTNKHFTGEPGETFKVGVNYFKEEYAMLCLLRKVDTQTESDVKSIDIKALCLELRDRTGEGLLTCKAALMECNYDVDEATKLLRDRAVAWKKGY